VNDGYWRGWLFGSVTMGGVVFTALYVLDALLPPGCLR
jgi:hypothetical protein